jgi:V/A-type H+/Na+-transporting ATPase subunit F
MAEKLGIYVIGSEDTVIGFGLIGLSGKVVRTVKEAQTILSEVAQKKEYKIIIINSRLIDGIEEFVTDYRLNPENPVLVEIPDETGAAAYESVKDLLKRSIGI